MSKTKLSPIWGIIEDNVPDDAEYKTADGLDDALLGVGQQFSGGCSCEKCGHSSGGSHVWVAVYSYSKCLDVFVKRDGMSYDEAIEYMDYNVLGAYLGENMPVFLMDLQYGLGLCEGED